MKVCLCCWGITEKLRKKEMFIVQMTFYQKKREEIFNKKKKIRCTFHSMIVFHNNIKLLLWQPKCCNY